MQAVGFLATALNKSPDPRVIETCNGDYKGYVRANAGQPEG